MHTEHEKAWPSVTQVLSVVDKPFLRIWYGKNGLEYCERVKKEAGEFGASLHDMIERRLRGEQAPAVSERHVQMCDLFERWKYQSNFTPVAIECKVESKEYEYHGTFDCIGHFGDSNSLFILDWKTSSKIDNLYGCQLAAYANAYKEETGICVAAGGVVRLEKDPTKPKQIEVKQFDNLDEYFEVFKACLKIHKFLHPGKRKK